MNIWEIGDLDSELSYLTSASITEIYDQHYEGIIGYSIFRNLVMADPTIKTDAYGSANFDVTSMGKYGKQIIQWYQKDPSWFDLPGSFSGLKEGLKTFIDLERYLPPELKVINKYKTARQFMEMVDGDLEEVKKKKMADKASLESEVFAEDGSWLVVIPKTHFASMYYAGAYGSEERAGWCTARDDSNYYNQYTHDGTLYMCMNKKYRTNSFQFFVPGDNPSSHESFEMTNFSNDTTSVDELPYGLTQIVKSAGLDLETIDADREPIYSYSGSIYGESERKDWGVVFDVRGNIDRYITTDDGTDIDEGYLGQYAEAQIVINKFNWRLSDKTMLNFPDVDLSGKGLVLEYKDGEGINSIEKILEQDDNWGEVDINEEWKSEFARGLGKAAHLPEGSTVEDPLITKDNIPTSFLVFIGTGDEEIDDDKSIVAASKWLSSKTKFNKTYRKDAQHPEIRNLNGGWVTVGPEELYYDGVTHQATIVYFEEAGDISNALNNAAFRRVCEIGLDSLSHWDEQEDADKQLKLGIDQRKKDTADHIQLMIASHRAAILSAYRRP